MFTKMGNKNKVRFVSIMYLGSILCVLGLGILSLPFVPSSTYLEVALTFGMTSLMGVQYYQVRKRQGELNRHRLVCVVF